MIVDSSAIMAILEDEAAAPALLDAALAGPLRMSTATWLEAAIVADQRSASSSSTKPSSQVVRARFMRSA